MVAKVFLVLTAAALFGVISAQCGNYAINYGCGYDKIIAPCGASSSGGGFGVSSSSAVSPSGLSVYSENNIAGTLNAFGQLPILAAVGVNGNLPTGGSASTTYSCGNGQVGISSDSLAAAGVSNSAYGGYGSASRGLGLGGYGLGLGSCGAPIASSCGCY